MSIITGQQTQKVGNFMLNRTVKAVSYYRVSSVEQEKGFSISAQKELLKEFAEERNIEIVKEFSEAETAKDAGRHEFNEMLKFMKKNKDIKTILVEKTDRLYRNFKDFVDLDVDKNNYTVYLVKEGTILTPQSSSHEKLVHGLKVLIAKNFIDNLREETQKGRKKKVKEGFFIGQVPYGYKKLDKRTTVLHEQRSKFVKRAFELYAQGNISLKNLVNQLYNEGYIYTTSNPKISTGQLEKMLKNESYIGLIRYRGSIYSGKHPLIVSKQLFMKAQKAFKKDGKPDTKCGHNFLYKGMLKCAECGCAITSEIKKGKWIYYHCTGNSKTPCTQKKNYIKQEELDLQVDEAIKRVVIDDSLADYINVLLEDSYKEMQINTKEKYNYLTTEIKKAQTRKDKLLEMYMDSDIAKDVWIKKTTDIDNQLNQLKIQLETMDLSEKQFIDEGKNIIEVAKQTYNLYKQQTIEEKRKLLNVIFDSLTLKDRVINFIYKKPFCYFAQCDLDNADGIVDYIKQNINIYTKSLNTL